MDEQNETVSKRMKEWKKEVTELRVCKILSLCIRRWKIMIKNVS